MYVYHQSLMELAMSEPFCVMGTYSVWRGEVDHFATFYPQWMEGLAEVKRLDNQLCLDCTSPISGVQNKAFLL